MDAILQKKGAGCRRAFYIIDIHKYFSTFCMILYMKQYVDSIPFI